MRVFGSLSNRIFLASALLAALSIGAALFFVRARLTAEAQQALDRDLQTAANIADQQQAALFDTFTRSARLLADLPRFKAAVDTGDAPTVQPIAEDYLRALGADLLQVHGRRGARLATAGGDLRGVLRVVEVPIRVDQDQLGVLTVGYLLDEDRAIEMAALTGADIAFAADGAVQASSLGPDSYPVLNHLPPAADSTTIGIGDTEYVALVRPLHPETAGRPASVVVMHSRTARMRTLAAIQTFLVALAIGSVLMAVALSYGVARTVTRPLATITDHMRQVAQSGDLTRKVALASDGGWHDDDAQVLASTFNGLTDAITRFQREATQRERLSALGRLSTVIAHEVRNPLMIIKGALRTVTRPGVEAADLKDAAADIDEEIARLNRLVHDVLDFSKPIRFECSATDINAVCEAARKAVAVNGLTTPALHAATALPALLTDRERLRMVLVNLLTNAQQAVEALPSRADAPQPLIVLSTAPLSGDRVVISVRDRGPGIAPDDLPRIFDPYFTTRRGGTGLGLAISKNVVEGLGGTLGVISRLGHGTEFRIELGHGPAAHT
jgi:two-component system, NtrC family, nitrogen regulation sensor histidine kinase NtrY